MKTAIELSDPLLERAKRLAARDSTTLRELVEASVRHVLKERAKPAQPFELRDAHIEGNDLSPQFAGASWNEIRDASYKGRGA